MISERTAAVVRAGQSDVGIDLAGLGRWRRWSLSGSRGLRFVLVALGRVEPSGHRVHRCVGRDCIFEM